MSPKTRIAVVVLGLAMAAIAGFNFSSQNAKHVTGVVASAVWGS